MRPTIVRTPSFPNGHPVSEGVSQLNTMKLTINKDVLIPLLSCSRIIAFVNMISANLTVKSSSLLEDRQKRTLIHETSCPPGSILSN